MNYAESTKSTYKSCLNAYLRFCLYFGRCPVPADNGTVVNYMVFLARSLKPSSIPTYMNIVRLLHLDAGLVNPLDSWEFTCIKRGIQRCLGTPPKQKLPITPQLLYKLKSTLSNSTMDKAFWCACLIAFFGFFRKSTLLPKSYSNIKHCLLVKDVTFDTDIAYIRVRHSKTNQFGQRVLVIPFATGWPSELCPVKALKDMLGDSMLDDDNVPLFTFSRAKSTPSFIDYNMFIKSLKSSLLKAGVNPEDYSGHSFRRGGCSYAISLGLPHHIVKLRGDWKSNCYERYIHINNVTNVTASRALMKGLNCIYK